MENISNIIETFLNVKEIEEGCSITTIKAYRYDLKKFIELIGDLKIDDPYMREKIRQFLGMLKEKGYTRKGIGRKIGCLRSFFKFLTVNEYILKDPMNTIKSPKINREETLPKFLSLQDIEKILKEVQNKQIFNSKRATRYYLIIRLLYSTMARISELCNIKIEDIDFNKGYIRLHGKGNKERIIPIDQKTIEILKANLKERHSYSSEDYLLLNTRDHKLTPRIIQKDIELIKAKCGFPNSKKITPHIFRHTGATHLRRAGMDLSELQDILGHSSPNTTRIYAKNDITQLKQSFSEKHPLNNKILNL